jgi:hypothetical protein
MDESTNLPKAPVRQTPDVAHWHAGFNQPGYLPESEPGTFATFEAAAQSLAEDMDRHSTSEETWADEHDCDDVPCPTRGEDCHWQRARAIDAERADLLGAEGPAWAGATAGLAYWVTRCGDTRCVSELVARLAGEFADEGDALDAFAASGAVRPGVAEEADEHRWAASAADQSDLELLCAYLAAVGERGPVPDWPTT